MKLIEDWKQTILKAWSVRAAIFVALLPVVEHALPQFIGQINPFVYSGLMIALVIARVLSQS